MLTRRRFLQELMGLPLLPFLVGPEKRAEAALALPQGEEKTSSIGEFFDGEELSYEIGFWVFKRAAVGKLTFQPGEKRGQYVSTLRAETLGVVGWVSRYRVDTYRATMEEVEGGKRLRSLSFEENVKIGDKTRKWFHEFDYERRRWVRTRKKERGKIQRYEEPIPPGMVYDDFLTASYNFRYGVYGPVERGRRYVIPTFPRKGSSAYEVTVAREEEERKRRGSQRPEDGKEFLVKLFLDPEVTHSQDGTIEGWLSKGFLPTEGTIKNVILFGDVRGVLTKAIRKSA